MRQPPPMEGLRDRPSRADRARGATHAEGVAGKCVGQGASVGAVALPGAVALVAGGAGADLASRLPVGGGRSRAGHTSSPAG